MPSAALLAVSSSAVSCAVSGSKLRSAGAGTENRESCPIGVDFAVAQACCATVRRHELSGDVDMVESDDVGELVNDDSAKPLRTLRLSEEL